MVVVVVMAVVVMEEEDAIKLRNSFVSTVHAGNCLLEDIAPPLFLEHTATTFMCVCDQGELREKSGFSFDTGTLAA